MLISIIVAECHSSSEAGRFGFHKTLARIKHNFLWPRMHSTVKEFLCNYDICQRNKSDYMRPTGLLQPLPIPTKIWTKISMDFVEGFPPSNGNTVIIVVVDRLTRYAHFVPLRHPFIAVTVAKAFAAECFQAS
ncbi:hypothetical protein LWI28_007825 [Acer negundo]|uniref:Integrase zinc-binding domain-containing protein n=1 Tax=Acer negundo TaxID=4023 RepID=A0AAD5IPF2_ACENE|nr:hypothetical protein LWI28_007825 [Acer negundo]